MTAVVLCGGLGTRLRPVVRDLPKVLAPVAGVPFLDHVFRFLAGQGVRDVVLCTGYGAERVSEWCGDGSAWGLRIASSRESEPLGTAGAIRNALPLVGDGPYFALNADSLVGADLGALAAAHEGRRAAITIALTEVADQSAFGSVGLADGGAVTGFFEKGRQGPGLINAGVYVIDPGALDGVPPGRAVSIEREVFPGLVGRGLYGLVVPGPFIDMGSPDAYELAQSVVRDWPGRSGA